MLGGGRRGDGEVFTAGSQHTVEKTGDLIMTAIMFRKSSLYPGELVFSN